MAANGISTLTTREERQKAKLALAAEKKGIDFDIGELPTRYSGNTVVDNANASGLLQGRPWILPTDSFRVLYLDGDNLNSYGGTGSTWTDLQGNANGTLANSPTWTEDGGYFTLNGTTQGATVPDVMGTTDFTLAYSYTVEVWMRPAVGQPSATMATVVEKWAGGSEGYPYTFRYNESTSTVGIAAYDGGAYAHNPGNTATGVTAGAWHQVVGVFNNSSDTLTCYVDGAITGSPTSTASLVNAIAGTSPLNIGFRSGGTWRYKGDIGIVRIYAKALSAEEVATNFRAERDRFGI